MRFSRKYYARKRRTSGGQAILEYIIIIALVAVAALTVLGLFGDRIRALISGSTKAIGGQGDTNNTSSLQTLQTMEGGSEEDIDFGS